MERPMSVTPESWVPDAIREIRDDVKHLVREQIGQGTKLDILWSEREERKRAEEARARLKIVPVDPETSKIRWRAIGEVAVALGMLASFALHFFGG